MNVSKIFPLARLLMSRAVTVAGVVAVLAACVQGLSALEKLSRKSENDEPDAGLDSAAKNSSEPTDERDASAMATVINAVLQQAAELDRESQEAMITVVAQGMSKLRHPVAQRVVEILVTTTGQSADGAIMLSILLRKMYFSDASSRFFASIRKQLQTLRAKLPSEDDLEGILDRILDNVSSAADTAEDKFGSLVGGIYEAGKRASDSATNYFREVRGRWSSTESDDAEDAAAPTRVGTPEETRV